MQTTESTNRISRFQSRAERDEYYADVFRSVVTQYLEVLQLPVVSAMQLDPDSSSRSRRLCNDDIHFKIDVERATETALRDRPELQRAWFKLGGNEAVDTNAEAVIHKCGRLYAARGLTPSSYYRQNRHSQRKQVTG